MKQLKTIVNKKLLFLFLVLGSAMSVQAQLTNSNAQTLFQDIGKDLNNYTNTATINITVNPKLTTTLIYHD